ncbi:MAG: leucine-rich repeat domain-containing protein [Candidatus Hodarchaeota archaeon]
MDDDEIIKKLEKIVGKRIPKIDITRDRVLACKEIDGKIIELHFPNCNIDDITKLKGLENLDQLQVLDLGNNLITEIEGLDKIPQLKKLHLDSNQISEIKGLDELPNLEFLSIYYNKISEMKGLDNLPKLRLLNLSQNQITEIKGLENLTQLTRLIISGNQIEEITGLENQLNLTELMLSENKISKIKGLENLTKLATLWLGNNNITEITGLENTINLNFLHLPGNKITEIKGLENLKQLRSLSFYSNKITDIKGLDTLAQLEKLDLENNKISEVNGLDELTRLKSLNISRNPFVEVEDLEKIKNLEKFKVEQDKIIPFKIESPSDPCPSASSLEGELDENFKGWLQDCYIKRGELDSDGIYHVFYLENEAGTRLHVIDDILAGVLEVILKHVHDEAGEQGLQFKALHGIGGSFRLQTQVEYYNIGEEVGEQGEGCSKCHGLLGFLGEEPEQFTHEPETWVSEYGDTSDENFRWDFALPDDAKCPYCGEILVINESAVVGWRSVTYDPNRKTFSAWDGGGIHVLSIPVLYKGVRFYALHSDAPFTEVLVDVMNSITLDGKGVDRFGPYKIFCGIDVDGHESFELQGIQVQSK